MGNFLKIKKKKIKFGKIFSAKKKLNLGKKFKIWGGLKKKKKEVGKIWGILI